eukprot:TRINITY_DN6594_c0_g2_i2.p1 TRINITY_DN6594_c0_g2~~TRINITY_DN6594_c0_g2_i2.p1  ORF type:complete len:282 (-),score=57.93 TRINITY_DN6594_c0_g2_i2:317-1096(-)
MEDLMLDTAIRDWVLVPLTLVMILVGLLRNNVSRMMKSEPTVDQKALKEGQVVLRARTLRAGANYIPERAFRMRRLHFNNTENGLLHVMKGTGNNHTAAMMTDPSVATNMIKGQLGMIVPNTVMYAWVNFFFSGFVAAKIPFPLTQRFRPMLQNGIDLSSVNVSYVSSRSWYFMNMFGLNGLFSLILGSDNQTNDAQRLMQTQMAMQMGGFGADPNKTLVAEKEAIELTQYEWELPKCEARAEAILQKLLREPPRSLVR